MIFLRTFGECDVVHVVDPECPQCLPGVTKSSDVPQRVPGFQNQWVDSARAGFAAFVVISQGHRHAGFNRVT